MKSSYGTKLFAAYALAFVILATAYAVSAAGNFSCSITASGSCSYTKVLYLENDTGGYMNAHAQNVTPGTYPYAICCDSNSSIALACGEGTLFKLNATTNSHVQRGDYTGPGIVYGVNACMTAAPGYTNCTYVDDACPADRECFASMASSNASVSNDTDAHVGPCTEYRKKACCKVMNDVIVAIIAYVSPTPNPGSRTIANSVTINVTVATDPGVNANTCILEWTIGAGSPQNETMTMRGSGSNVTCDSVKVTDDGTDYTFKVYANDSSGTMGNESSRSFRENALPAKVSLSSPADGSNTTDRTPTFSWSAPNDADGDTPLNYTINITCFPSCSDDNWLVTDIMTMSYTPALELKYFGDDNYHYNWSVRAGDTYEYGQWSDKWNLTIFTNVTMEMLNSLVDFGANRIPGYADNTSDGSPQPFAIRNTGNCMMDVNISSTKLLWDSASSPSSYFRYKADSYPGEGGSFNYSGSQTSWANVPVSDSLLLDNLNYTSGNSSFEADLSIQVPGDEPPGAKNSTIIFTGSYAK